jgi:stearoyl-CoA desaturase (delta-9 desaturase)
MCGEDDFKMEIVWRNVVLFIYIHCCAVYGLMLQKETWSGVVMAWAYGFMCAFGTTIGAHRLYTHRAFRANRQLQVLLLFWQTMAVQNSMYEWVRDHRVHHKYTDTNADPHNAKRGFFFSHMGWLMCKKHPDVKKFGAKIDMSDLENDKLVMLQHRYYFPLALLVGFIAPVLLGLACGEKLTVVWHGHILRYIIGLHLVWCINSVAHFWGTKPYDKWVYRANFLRTLENYQFLSLDTETLHQRTRISWAHSESVKVRSSDHFEGIKNNVT